MAKMTKYKLNNDERSVSEVTLTSYLAGGDRPNYLDTPRSMGPATCHFCPHSCEFLQQADVIASLDKSRNDYSLNELKIEGLDVGVCLCEKYNGGCKLCPLPSDAHGESSPYGNCNALFSKEAFANGLPAKNGDLPYSTKGGARAGSKWRSWASRCCSYKVLTRRLPIAGWLPRYTFSYALSDLIAGMTVGLTVIPQAIAYAGVAGLPPQYGLYSSFMASFVYAALGSVRVAALGPTAIAAILTRENIHGLGPEFAVLLAFLSGCVEFLMGLLQLGFLVDFISGPVSAGFTSAAAIIIATSQLKDILGLSISGGKFLQVWRGVFEHVAETRAGDAALGAICIAILLLLRKVKDIKVSGAAGQVLWFLSATRNIFVVVVSSVIAYCCHQQGLEPFRLSGEVRAGLPEFSLPPFSATVGNHTYSFGEMTATLGSAIVVVPLLSILENIALAKVFAEGRPIDATQEMLALGVCNVVSSLAHSMPVSGALSRGAVSHASGVATPAAGIYTGLLVLLALQYLTPYFFYIPKAALAAVIIAAVLFMVELHVVKPIWRTKKMDVVPAVVTFAVCLAVRLEVGIAAGVCVALAMLLHGAARPAVRVDKRYSPGGVPHVVATVDRALAFPAAEHVRRALAKAAHTHDKNAEQDRHSPLVIDASHVFGADFTAAKGLKSVIEECAARGQPVIFFNMRPRLLSALRGVRSPSAGPLLHANSTHDLDLMLRRLATPAVTPVASSVQTEERRDKAPETQSPGNGWCAGANSS